MWLTDRLFIILIVMFVYSFLSNRTKTGLSKKVKYELAEPSDYGSVGVSRKTNNMYDSMKHEIGDYTHASVPLAITKPGNAHGYIRNASGRRLPVFEQGGKYYIKGANGRIYEASMEDLKASGDWVLVLYDHNAFSVPWAMS